MSEAKSDGLATLTSKVPAWLLVLALGGGAVGNFVGFTQDTTDRYHASTAAKDFAIRDAQINSLESYRIEHTQHAAVYTERINEMWRLINRVPPEEINSSITQLEDDLRKMLLRFERLEAAHIRWHNENARD